ncbi:hypothetical protein RB195_025336 [Necator americanus]|uniref:Integrase catalytic domain-containing protein n=1 Tax=Necator americanus TaxID=51031 RepID=A0ABR1ESI0_NECAM
MTDLPPQRVKRSRPFHHIGLDYFGPISVYEGNKDRAEVYGCIFTCAVTRLIHLEVVSDGTTKKFINAFRRFVAGRGKPKSVTCDNAPTFLLGSRIINDSLEKITTDEEILHHTNNQLIEWNHITPYSPWKGGFYERLIKSVKHALFKVIGKRIITREPLCTFFAEIEGCISSRPLTYQESDFDNNISTLRPIDFLQRDMYITLPLRFSNEEQADPTYLPSSEAARLETRLQTEKALQSSYSLTERYWNIWRTHYLPALYEQHRQKINDQRGSTKAPRKGEIVLLSDPCQKRNYWKMARITKLLPSKDGPVREVEVLCNNKSLRHPINHLIPLEISEANCELQPSDEIITQTREQPSTTRYNLRKRKSTVSRQHTSSVHQIRSERSKSTWSPSVYLKMALILAIMTITTGTRVLHETQNNNSFPTPRNHYIECKTEGVYLNAPQAQEYELCVNNYCINEKTPPVEKLLHLPPEELIHDYEANWKVRQGDTYVALVTKCPAQSFCTSIDCTICSANILNPECWPLAAIIGLGISVYLFIALCYTICFVPVTIGPPCRIIMTGIATMVYMLVWFAIACLRKAIV